MALEASSEWEGPRSSYGKGRTYWISKRNENASWRLWHLERVQGKKIQRPRWAFHSDAEAQKNVCEKCALGHGVERICSCRPDPWQPIPAVEPDGQEPYSMSMREPTRQVLPEVPRLMLPPGLEREVPISSKVWRRLLRGSHAFSLQGAPGNVSLYYSNPDEALVARQRFQNAGWRRWWVEQKLLMHKQLSKRQDVVMRTPGPSQPASPRCSAQGEGCLPYGGSYVLLPVPAHLVSPLRLYADKLQGALDDLADQRSHGHA